jgi:hypothetical protein
MSLFRPKNRNQGIYWVRYYLDHVDRPEPKPRINKQDEYRQVLLQMLDCFTQENYPKDVADFIGELERVLQLKRITSKHMDNITCNVKILSSKYKES